MRQGEYALPRLMPHKGDSVIEARRILARQSVLLGGSHDRLRKRLVEELQPLIAPQEPGFELPTVGRMARQIPR